MDRLSRTRSIILFLLLVFLLSVFVSVNAQTGTTYYVATDGNDTNPGTEAQPFRTLTKGVSVLKPGDTLLVKQGVYREELNNKIPSGLSWQQPVTLRAYPGHQVIIQPNLGAQRVITISGDRHYIIIDGFIIDGTNVSIDAIKIAGVMDATKPNPSHIRIINNEIRNVGVMKTANKGYVAYGNGILSTGLSNYLEYINNRIHNNGLTDYDHGIYHTASYALIEGNIVYNNKGTGIKIGWGQDARDNIVRNNQVYDNNTAQGANGQKKQGRGIGVYAGSGTQVYNNIIWGAHAMGIDVTYGGHNARIFNNTIYNASGYGISIGGGVGDAEAANNAVVENNLVYQQSTYPAIYNSRGVNVIIRNNLTYGQNPRIETKNPASTIIQDNLENVDPGFISLASRNFALQPNSPAIDRGTMVSGITFDFFRNIRPMGLSYDIGAFEFQGTAVPTQPFTPTPPVATPVPPTPTPLVVNKPTIFLSMEATAAPVGSMVSIAVNVAHSENLYGLEIRCTTDPAVLVGIDTAEGTIFTSANSLFMNRPYNPADGSWAVAASRTRPEPAFSGDGVAFILNYQAQGVGDTPVSCSAIAVDQAGATLPFDVVNSAFSVQPPPVPPGQPTTEPPSLPEIPGPDEPPLPTDEPTPLPTEVVPTATAVPPTPTPVLNTGSITGLADYQTLLDNLGIQVQLLADDVLVGETTTDSTGAFSFNNLAPGSYTVRVFAPQHLPAAHVVIVEPSGQVITLEPLTLLAGDIDDNGVIDLADAGMIGANYGLEGSLVPLADINRDNIINIGDLVIIGINFGLSAS